MKPELKIFLVFDNVTFISDFDQLIFIAIPILYRTIFFSMDKLSFTKLRG